MHGVLGHVCFPTRSKKNTKKTSTTKAITFVLFIVELSILEHMKRSWHQSCSPVLSESPKSVLYPVVCFRCFWLFFVFFLPGGGKTDILLSPAAFDNYASSTSSLNTNCIESTFVALLIYHSTSFMTNV